MTTISILPLEQAAISIAAAVISIFGGLALNALRQRFNLQVSTDQAALYEGALNKALQYGVTQAETVIKAKGWDHVDTKSAVIADALDYVIAREPAALAGVGLSTQMEDPKTRAVLTQALQRALPAAFTTAAASPATPPAPTTPAPAAILLASPPAKAP